MTGYLSPKCTNPSGAALFLTVVAGAASVNKNATSVFTILTNVGNLNNSSIILCNGLVLIGTTPNGNTMSLDTEAYDPMKTYSDLSTWRPILRDDGTYAIMNISYTDFYLNVSGNDYPSGTTVIAWGNFGGEDNEVWNFVAA